MNNEMMGDIKRPSWLLYMTEGIRAGFEFVRSLLFLWMTPRERTGNGKVIMIVPGLLTSDRATTILRRYLEKKGYQVYGWELGLNWGRMDYLPQLTRRVAQLSREHQQPITLLGWSMGGLFVREVARANPHLVAKVITMGSPFSDIHAPNNARWVFDLLNSDAKPDTELVANLPLRLPMPSVAIYSKMDGIVPWQACMELMEDAQHRNAEVRSSHFGMGANPRVMRVVHRAMQIV